MAPLRPLTAYTADFPCASRSDVLGRNSPVRGKEVSLFFFFLLVLATSPLFLHSLPLIPVRAVPLFFFHWLFLIMTCFCCPLYPSAAGVSTTPYYTLFCILSANATLFFLSRCLSLTSRWLFSCPHCAPNSNPRYPNTGYFFPLLRTRLRNTSPCDDWRGREFAHSRRTRSRWANSVPVGFTYLTAMNPDVVPSTLVRGQGSPGVASGYGLLRLSGNRGARSHRYTGGEPSLAEERCFPRFACRWTPPSPEDYDARQTMEPPGTLETNSSSRPFSSVYG